MTLESAYNRLLVTYRRVITNRPDGSVPDGSHFLDKECSVLESLNLVHPDDARHDQKSKQSFNTFRELGAMFKDNPNYYDVKYVSYPVANALKIVR